VLLKVVWVLTPVGLVVVDVKLELLAVELVAKGDELLGFKVFTVDVTLFEAEPSAFFDDKSELLLT
jgi:hypothetical protein